MCFWPCFVTLYVSGSRVAGVAALAVTSEELVEVGLSAALFNGPAEKKPEALVETGQSAANARRTGARNHLSASWEEAGCRGDPLIQQKNERRGQVLDKEIQWNPASDFPCPAHHLPRTAEGGLGVIG